MCHKNKTKSHYEEPKVHWLTTSLHACENTEEN